MRAIVTHRCGACGWSTRSKSEMEEHADDHAQNYAPAQFKRADDQLEFKPSLRSTPWGRDLR
jgi:hypothetical protein